MRESNYKAKDLNDGEAKFLDSRSLRQRFLTTYYVEQHANEEIIRPNLSPFLWVNKEKG